MIRRIAKGSLSQRGRAILGVFAAIGCIEESAPSPEAGRGDAATDRVAPSPRDAPLVEVTVDVRGVSEGDPLGGDIDVARDASIPALADVTDDAPFAGDNGASGDAASDVVALPGDAHPVSAGYVRVEPGTFQMGSPMGEPGRHVSEAQHAVTLTRAFAVKETEVTQGEWFARMGARPSFFTRCGDACPVESVSWYDALAYCNALSRAEGLPLCYADAEGADYDAVDAENRVPPTWRGGPGCTGYRLPTEAEWEYAARAGTTEATYNGAVGDVYCGPSAALDPIAWACGNSAVTYEGCWNASAWGGPECAGTHPVAGRRPNPWGLHDTLGNVWEWVWDRYGEGLTDAPQDPTGPMTGERRVFRGGAWGVTVRGVRAARREREYPERRVSSIGIRPVRSLP